MGVGEQGPLLKFTLELPNDRYKNRQFVEEYDADWNAFRSKVGL